MGATEIMAISEDTAQLIKQYQGWADIAFEVTGHADNISPALHCTKKGGTLYLVGLYRSLGNAIDCNQVVVQEKKILGGLGSPSVWEKSISMLKSHNLPLNRLITHRFPFSEIEKAYDMALHRLDNMIKAVILIKTGNMRW